MTDIQIEIAHFKNGRSESNCGIKPMSASSRERDRQTRLIPHFC